VEEREQTRLKKIHDQKIKAAKPTLKTRPAKSKKSRGTLAKQLENSISELDKLLQEQEEWGPNFGRLSTVLESSQEFSDSLLEKHARHHKLKRMAYRKKFKVYINICVYEMTKCSRFI